MHVESLLHQNFYPALEKLSKLGLIKVSESITTERLKKLRNPIHILNGKRDNFRKNFH